jgi:hypothetical protein
VIRIKIKVLYMMVRTKVLIGVVALFAASACLLLGMSMVSTGALSIPFLDPHSIPFLDPHSIPFLDPHSISF